ncbi:unnamed protein product [Ectocarpus sp. 12 AP-2014]
MCPNRCSTGSCGGQKAKWWRRGRGGGVDAGNTLLGCGVDAHFPHGAIHIVMYVKGTQSHAGRSHDNIHRTSRMVPRMGPIW